MRKMIVGILAWAACAAGSAGAFAATPILRVIVVQPTDLKAYVHEVDTLRAEFKKAGITATLRVWQARFAGPEAGAIVVAVEVPDLATLVKMDEAQKSNAAIGATMQKIGTLRKILSDSLYEELSP